MPKATPTNTTNARPASVTAPIPADRRTMLAGIVAVLAFPAVAEASGIGSNSDAVLIHAGATCLILDPQIAALNAQFFATPSDSPDIETIGAQEIALSGSIDDLVDMAIETPAATPEGCRAKAILLRSIIERYDDDGGPMPRLAMSLCNDMAGGRV